MTQLTLFSDLTTDLANEVPAIVPVTAVPVTTRPRPIAPTTAAEAAPTDDARKNDARKNDARKKEGDTLLALAALIRDGRAAAEAQSRLRSRPIQSIGDLAQSVLLRHDLVARRRAMAAGRAVAPVSSQEHAPVVVHPATRVAGVGLAQTPAQVHVAS